MTREFNVKLHQCSLPDQFWVKGSPFTDAKVRASQKGTSRIILNGKEYMVTSTMQVGGLGRMHGKVYFLTTDRASELWGMLDDAFSKGRRSDRSEEEANEYAKSNFGVSLGTIRRNLYKERIQIMENPA